MSYKDREIISSGRLGLDLITDEFEKQGIKIAADRYSLKDGFEISKIENSEFEETWEPVWGENSEILNHYKEMEVDLYQTQADRHIIIRTRVFNEGVGFRSASHKSTPLMFININAADSEDESA